MTRQPTPDVLGQVLGPVDATKLIRAELRYDYSLIPAEQRNQVQAAAVEIVQAGRRAQESLLEVGKRLNEVKELLDYGQFSEWCSTEFDMSQRTAQRMMQVAKVFDGRNDTVSLLSDSAMYLLAAPSTPEEARVEVIEQAQSTGKSPTKAEVQATIRKHQPTPTPVKVTRIDDATEDAWTAKREVSTWQWHATVCLDCGFVRAGGNTCGDCKSSNGRVVYDQAEANRLAERVKQHKGTGRPLMEVIKTDAELAAEAEAADIASRNAAADEAERQAQAAAAAADAAFGMAKPPSRNERIDTLLHIFMAAVDALPEVGELTGHYTFTTALLRELNKTIQVLKDNKIGGYKANE